MDNGIRLSIADGETLLDGLLRHGVSLPHECDGALVCGSCRVVVREGFESLNSPTVEEQDLLDETASSELLSRLACQATGDGNIVVQIPPEYSAGLSPSRPTPAPPIALTERAAKHLAKQVAKRGGSNAVRLAVRRSGCSGLRYVVDYADAISTKDAVFECSGLRLVVDAESLPHLTSMTVDIETDGLSRRLRFENPNVKQTCGCGESFAT